MNVHCVPEFRALVFAFACASVCACATSPTGRKQLILLPEGQMSAMGAQAFDQMKQETPVSRDAAINSYVRCVAEPVAAQASEEAGVKSWDVVAFDEDKTVNAFALPGGKIGVYTGLLKVARTDAQLAAVLGHEVGHVIAHHGAERMSQSLATQGGLALAGALARDNPNRAMVLGALGLGAQLGVLLPYSRTQESEADLIGLDLMARAGFDPAQSVELWKNMSASGGAAPPEFLSTHPANQSRIENLQSHLAPALAEYRATRSRPVCRR